MPPAVLSVSRQPYFLQPTQFYPCKTVTSLILDIACCNLITAEAHIEQTDSRHTSVFTSAIPEMRKPSKNPGNRECWINTTARLSPGSKVQRRLTKQSAVIPASDHSGHLKVNTVTSDSFQDQILI